MICSRERLPGDCAGASVGVRSLLAAAAAAPVAVGQVNYRRVGRSVRDNSAAAIEPLTSQLSQVRRNDLHSVLWCREKRERSTKHCTEGNRFTQPSPAGRIV